MNNLDLTLIIKAKRNALPLNTIDKIKLACVDHGGKRDNASYGRVRADD